MVRQVLHTAGIEAPGADRIAADVLHTDGNPRFVWKDPEPDQRDYPAMIAASLWEGRAGRSQQGGYVVLEIAVDHEQVSVDSCG